MEKQNIRIKLRAYDNKILDASTEEIVNTVKRTGATIKGPVPLPTRIERYTVLKGPHIDKKSREQFETRTHKRLIDIIEPTPQTVEALMKSQESKASLLQKSRVEKVLGGSALEMQQSEIELLERLMKEQEVIIQKCQSEITSLHRPGLTRRICV